MMSTRDKALARFKKSTSPAHWEYYKSLRNLTTSAIRKEKKAYIDHSFHSNEPKVLWQKLKNLSIRLESEYNLPSALANADEINNFFISSVQKLITKPDH